MGMEFLFAGEKKCSKIIVMVGPPCKSIEDH